MLYSTTKGGSILKRKKTEVISLRRISAAVKMFSEKIYSDHITLYAAQSSFFTMIATIPFLMLLITLIRIVFPDAIDSVFIELERILPEKFSPLFSTVYTEISSKNTASVLSFSAITMFWSSSRGSCRGYARGRRGLRNTRPRRILLGACALAVLHRRIHGADNRNSRRPCIRSHRALHRRKQLSRRASHIRSHHTSADVYISRAAHAVLLSRVFRSLRKRSKKRFGKSTKPPSDTDVRYPARSSRRRAGCCIRISILCISSTSRMHRTFTEAWRRSFSSCFGFTSV